MASFALRDLENRIDHIETARLKNLNNDVSKPQRSVLGVINQNTSKTELSRKAKDIPNEKISFTKDKCNTKANQPQSTIFTRLHQKSTKSSFQFTIHEDDSSDVVENRLENTEKHKLEVKCQNKENEQFFDQLCIVPESFCKPKVWKNDEEEPMSLEKSILSPMSVDLSHTEKHSPVKKNVEDYICMLINTEDYRDDIYEYLTKCERRIRPKANYMKKQPDINADMRSVLVDWLIEVAEEYNMQNETLHLAINYIDRFLSLMSVVRSKLQLLGTTALFVASKYEEIYPQEVGEFVFITDDTYTKKQVLKMETLLLKVLNFDLNIPTVHSFICHITVSAKLSSKVLYMAQYLSELALVSGDPFLEFVPSMLASASISLALYCLDYEQVWPDKLTATTSYRLEDLVHCIKCLHDVHVKGESGAQTAAYKKYKTDVWKNVATVEARTFTK